MNNELNKIIQLCMRIHSNPLLTQILSACSVEFGEVTSVMTDTGAMYQIQEDLHKPGHVLYNAFRSIRSAPLSDLLDLEVIAGDYWTDGANDGIGYDVTFSWIAHFVQLNATTILIADSGSNHCLRLLDRETKRVSHFLGTCGTKGYRDGSDPLFDTPNGLLIDRENQNGVFLADMFNHVIRYIDLENRTAMTIEELRGKLVYPEYFVYNITQPAEGIQFFISNNYYIISVTRKRSTNYESNILAGVKNIMGHLDGRLSAARFDNLKQMVMVDPHTLVVAEAVSKDLRVVDTHSNRVSSLCFQGGSDKGCSLMFPVGLALINGSIYIADNLDIRKVTG